MNAADRRRRPVPPGLAGYRRQAEWDAHDATWIVWPQNASDWPGKAAAIPWVYAEIVRAIAPGERVCILASSRPVEDRARRILLRTNVDPDRVEFFRIPTNRGWIRDSGPLFLTRPKGRPRLVAADFRFNGWARYDDWQDDDRVPRRIAARLGLPCYPARAGRRRFVLEGGSIEVNGAGDLVTTEACLLEAGPQARNPHLSREAVERVLRDMLGVRRIHWLGKGIEGDDTHGHVDDICRFVGPRTLVACREPDRCDANHRPLEENLERLKGFRLADGSRPEVVELPMPAPVRYGGQRLPASYANFYIANAAVLVPTFNDPNDRVALGILGELVADRPVVGIHATDLVLGLGALHCLTQEQPDASRRRTSRAEV